MLPIDILDVILQEEGGFDLTRADSGNWTGGAVGRGELRGTKWGISAAAYPTLDIEALTKADAQAIYDRDYWQPLDEGAMPRPLALIVFDAAVNNGVWHAVRWLQESVGANVDGVMGPLTIAATTHTIAATGWQPLAIEFMAQRLVGMAALPTWRVFGLGWARRLSGLPYAAMALQIPAGGLPASS